MNQEKIKKAKDQVVEMTLVRPNAARIDVGSTFHVIGVPPGRDEPRVRTFGAMTCDLKEVANWLKKCGIDSVGMESTGVYWKGLFTTLIQNGFEVALVNAAQVRNVSGRKNDEDDAMWIQKLHSCGLLKSSYLPDDEQSAIRTLVRYRKTLAEDYSKCVLRMQKSLELMNIEIYTVIDDITGRTGTRIIEAILAGERNPKNFLPFVDIRIKASKDTIAKSLEGNWRAEHLFTLRSCYELFQFYKQSITQCDVQIEHHLQRFEARQNEGVLEPLKKMESEQKTPRLKKKNNNSPLIDIRKYLQNIHGVDVMEIYGISDLSGFQILGETGTDLSKWENEKHFTSWLNLRPNTLALRC